jgi:addiction module HigA family antidote
VARQVPYPHPGEILAEEFIGPMGITAYRLAKTMGVPQTRIAAIISGERGITADTGLRLSRALGTSDEFWMNLQRDYDTALARDALAGVLADIHRLEAAA